MKSHIFAYGVKAECQLCMAAITISQVKESSTLSDTTLRVVCLYVCV